MRINIVAYPYVTQDGSIIVPDELKGNSTEIYNHIKDHWDEVKLEDPNMCEFDYCGIEFDFYEYE